VPKEKGLTSTPLGPIFRGMKNANSSIGLLCFDSVEGRSTGIAIDEDGYIALTTAHSKRFKTLVGAVRWLARRGYNPNGTRVVS
jgi:hypothetical protein